MKKRISKIGIVLACVLIPVGAMGFGYFSRQDNENNKQVTHTLTVDGQLGGSVVNTQETNTDGIVPGDTVDETINVQPNATALSLLRVKIEPSWYNGNSKTSLLTSNIEFLYANNVETELADNPDDYWYKNGDYLYYMNSVTTKEDVMELVKGIKFLGGTNDTNAQDYQGKKLKITVTMDMIQCKYAPFKKKWGVLENSQLYAKLEDLCPDADKKVE